MNKMVWFTTVSILSFVFVLPVLLSLTIDYIPNANQPGYGQMGRVSIYGSRSFKQEFVSEKEMLTGIGTSIKNPNLNNKSEVIFNLYDEGNNLIRNASISGKNIGDGDFVKIIFDPVIDSKGKKFIIEISSPQAPEDELLELFLTSKNNYILNFIYESEKREGGIPMVTYHNFNSRFEIAGEIYKNLFRI